jgi:hypothetical protein
MTRMRARGHHGSWIVAWIAIMGGWPSTRARDARADRYEAAFTMRPIGAVGRIAQRARGVGDGDAFVSRNGGGGEVSFSYGVRNWLDVEGEVAGAGFAQAIYDPVTVLVAGSTVTGRLARTTRLVQLRAGATLRFGVGWVPTVHLGVGVGGRVLTAGMLHDEERAHTYDVTPDGMSGGVAIDVVACARIGLEHRLDRRWSVGLSAEASYAAGFGTPPLEVVAAGAAFSYTWYPLVQP